MGILVTGGAGFIGSHLVDRLLSLGKEVIVVDDFSLGNEKNLEQHKDNKKLKIFRKSILDDLSEVFKEDVEIVFHLAAKSHVQFSIQYPINTHNIHIGGTLSLLNYCRKFGVKRFVFSSSCAVYGDQEILPYKETADLNPMSPYALHKVIAEKYCKLFNFLYGLESVSLRYFNVFGPRQNEKGGYASLIPKFISLVSKNMRLPVNGDGNQTRDFIYVEDVINANIIAGLTKEKKVFGEVFNIGSGREISVNEVTRMIIRDKNIEPLFGPAVIEPRRSLADISKAEQVLGWKKKFSFEEGLEKTFEFFGHKQSL